MLVGFSSAWLVKKEGKKKTVEPFVLFPLFYSDLMRTSVGFCDFASYRSYSEQVVVSVFGRWTRESQPWPLRICFISHPPKEKKKDQKGKRHNAIRSVLPLFQCLGGKKTNEACTSVTILLLLSQPLVSRLSCGSGVLRGKFKFPRSLSLSFVATPNFSCLRLLKWRRGFFLSLFFRAVILIEFNFYLVDQFFFQKRKKKKETSLHIWIL